MKDKRTVSYFLMFVLGMQFFFICFLNLTQLQYHIGHDTSVLYYYAVEMWRQKSLILSEWEYQSTLALDSPVLLASLIYGITGKVFISYGISNIVSTVIFLGVFYRLLDRFELKMPTKLILLNFVLGLRYVQYFDNYNSINYGSVMFVQNGAYIIKTVVALLLIMCFIDISSHKDSVYLIIGTAVLALICGFSSGYWILATIIAPLLLWRLFEIVPGNTFKTVIRDTNIIYLVFLSVLSVAGQTLRTTFFGFNGIDTTMKLITVEDFWKNFGSIFAGFVELNGGLPNEDVSAMSLHGIFYLLNLAFSVMMFIALIMTVRNHSEKKSPALCTALVIIFGNIALFAICDTTYGARTFETRYLIVAFLMMSIVLGVFLEKSILDRFGKERVTIFLCICFLVLNIYSFSLIYGAKINYKKLTNLTSIVDQYDAEVVYMFGDDLFVYGRDIRVIDTTKIYKYVFDDGTVYHWGDTTRYDYGYNGSVIIVTTVDGYGHLPREIRGTAQVIDNGTSGFVILGLEENTTGFAP